MPATQRSANPPKAAYLSRRQVSCKHQPSMRHCLCTSASVPQRRVYYTSRGREAERDPGHKLVGDCLEVFASLVGVMVFSLDSSVRCMTVNRYVIWKAALSSVITPRDVEVVKLESSQAMGPKLITPLFVIWELISQLHMTTVTQGFLARLLLCNLGRLIRYFCERANYTH